MDFSPAYIERATRNVHDPRIAFEVRDARTLAFPDRSYDRVLSLLMLHFVPRADQAIAEMRRVARPGAVVGAAVWDARGGFVATRMFCDTAAVLDRWRIRWPHCDTTCRAACRSLDSRSVGD